MLPTIHLFMLQVLLITSVDLHTPPGKITYETATYMSSMTEEECWKMAADINSHGDLVAGNTTAVCTPIIYPNRGQRGENQIGH